MTSPKKGQMLTTDLYFSYFGRPPVPDDICKDSAKRHLRFGEVDFKRVDCVTGARMPCPCW